VRTTGIVLLELVIYWATLCFVQSLRLDRWCFTQVCAYNGQRWLQKSACWAWSRNCC